MGAPSGAEGVFDAAFFRASLLGRLFCFNYCGKLGLRRTSRFGRDAETGRFDRNSRFRKCGGRDRRIARAARKAEGSFSPHTKGEAAAAKTRLLHAADRLNRYLATGGANGVAWKRYLKWDQMQQQLRAGATPDLAVLDRDP